MKKKILIVDDEPDIVSYLEMVLQDSGFETVTAGNGNEAMEAVKRERPDLVTLDISMPEASGTRFYKELRTDPDLSSIPVIIVTAVTGLGGDKYAYEKFISSRRLVPAPEAFFPKPIDREVFVEAVKGLLGE
jgi:CheY-like chemotaxis protein